VLIKWMCTYHVKTELKLHTFCANGMGTLIRLLTVCPHWTAHIIAVPGPCKLWSCILKPQVPMLPLLCKVWLQLPRYIVVFWSNYIWAILSFMHPSVALSSWVLSLSSVSLKHCTCSVKEMRNTCGGRNDIWYNWPDEPAMPAVRT